MPLTPEVQIIALGIIGGLLLINLLVLLLRRKNPELRNVADILFRGQAELAGRLTQISEYSRQQQDVIASAINEQRVSVLKIMDEKLLQVAKNVSEGLQQNTVKTNETLTDLRERLAKIDVAQQKYPHCLNRLCRFRKSCPINRRAALSAKSSLMIWLLRPCRHPLMSFRSF